MRRAAKFLFPIYAFVMLAGALPSPAQSLGEIARQVRERKSSEVPLASHIYTNEDLARQKILDSQDREQISSSSQSPTIQANAPLQPNTFGVPKWSQRTPLGDVARFYRREKQSKQQELAKRAIETADPSSPDIRTIVIATTRNDSRFSSDETQPQRHRLASRTVEVTKPTHLRAPVQVIASTSLTKEAKKISKLPEIKETSIAAAQAERNNREEQEHTEKVLASETFSPSVQPVTLAASPSNFKKVLAKNIAAAPRRASTGRGTENSGKTLLAHSTGERGEAAASHRIRVNRGDSLWNLARRYLRRGDEWPKIAAQNPQLSDPNRVVVGEWLSMPSDARPVTAREIRIGKGDSLWKVAQLELGSGLAWSCIAAANPQILEVDTVYPGQPVAIPSYCGKSI